MMGGPLTIIFSRMNKTEEKVVKPTNSRFCKRYVDDLIEYKVRDSLTLRLFMKLIKLK